jgi:hypothetical protein
MLEAQQANAWHDIVTLDESWCYFSRYDGRILLALEESVPDRKRHKI